MLNPERTATLLDRLDLRAVPAGIATLGVDDKTAEKFVANYGDTWHEYFFRETPPHAISVDAFGLARFPVTNALYAEFITAGGYTNGDYWTPEGWAWRIQTQRTQPNPWTDPKFVGNDRPVVGITWFEAIAFTRWAAQVTGQPIRFPTEAEWEWAARADHVRWSYPWGGVWDAAKLNSGSHEAGKISYGTTVPVGEYSPAGDGPFGHADLLGQVWEWSSSLFKPYPYAADEREDLYTPDRRVLRGGCWGDGRYANRVTARLHFPGNYADITTGFRLAVGATPTPQLTRTAHDLVIYGRWSFCPDLISGKSWLHAWGVPYRQINIDLDEQAAARIDEWLGSRTVPTYIVAERGQVLPITPPADADLSELRNANRGSMLHEADEPTLRAWLVQNGFLAASP